MRLVSDVTRLGAQVISGIGFLCAGTVMVSERKNVRGLTTAAGLWCTAIVGLAVGIGYYEAAVACVVMQVVSIWLLRGFEHRALSQIALVDFHLEINNIYLMDNILDEMRRMGFCMRNITLKPSVCNMENAVGLELTMELGKRHASGECKKQLSGIDGVIVVVEIR